MGNCPPSENPWILSPCGVCARQALGRSYHQLWYHVSTRGFTNPNYLSTPLFDPQGSEIKIALDRFRNITYELVRVTVIEDNFAPGVRALLEYEDPTSDYCGLTAIQYQGEIIQW